MTLPAMTPERFDCLLSGLVDGTLTAEELQTLEAVLAADEAAQRRHVEFMLLHGMLAWGRAGGREYREEGAASASEVFLPATAPATGLNRSRFARAAVAALAIGVLGLVFLWAPWSGEADGEIARLTKSVACRWSEASSVSEEQPVLRSGDTVVFSEGLAEVTFRNGSRLVLAGPAHVEVRSAQEVALRRGTLCARIAPKARGFTVLASELRIVDRGTEFGVRVDDSQNSAAIVVFQGEVEAICNDGKPTRSVHTIRYGQAVEYDAAQDAMTPSNAEGGRFVRDLSASRAVVDWRGDYTEARRLYPGETVEAHFGDDPNRTDRVRRRPFDELVPLCPEHDHTPVGRSEACFGGYEIWRLGGGLLPGGDSGLQDGGAQDFQRLWYSNGRDRRVYGVWFFPKAGFVDLRDGRVALGPASGFLVHVLRNEGGHFALRFLVKSGENWYLSQTASNQEGPFVLGGLQLAHEMWARYRPDRDLRANGSQSGTPSTASNLTCGAGALSFDTPTAALTNIEAVGLYAESIDVAGWPNRLLDWSRFTAYAEPVE
jgi:hypothetical protein